MELLKEEEFIIKYITNSISIKELDLLTAWVQDPENEYLFIEYVKLNYAIDINMRQFNTYKTQKQLLRHIDDTNIFFNHIKFRSFFRYAAILVFLLGISFFYHKDDRKLALVNETITIKLDNGKIEVIKMDGKKKILDKNGKIVGIQEGDKLNYKNDNRNSIKNSKEESSFNELTIPNGKRFQIILSDGTKVFLNAGTTLKYPVKFVDNAYRHVYLINGEAYFEVTKDPHNLFIVSTNEMDIKVLGTEFNISTYPEDSNINTVLVKGSVNLSGNKSYNNYLTSVLKPGFKAEWPKTNDKVTVTKVNTSIYTGWIKGKLIFKNIQFKDILKKLERKYNVTIINNNRKLDDQYFNATFDIETIEEVINSFSKSYKIEYTIKNNQIIIN